MKNIFPKWFKPNAKPRKPAKPKQPDAVLPGGQRQLIGTDWDTELSNEQLCELVDRGSSIVVELDSGYYDDGPELHIYEVHNEVAVNPNYATEMKAWEKKMVTWETRSSTYKARLAEWSSLKHSYDAAAKAEAEATEREQLKILKEKYE